MTTTTPITAPNANASVTFRDDVATIACWRNLAIFEYRGAWQTAHVGQVAALYERVFAQHERAVGLFIATPAATMSPRAVNDAFSKLLRKLQERVVVSTLVIEDRGTLAAIARGVIRTVGILAGNARIRVCATVDEAAPALLPHLAPEDGRPVTMLQLNGVLRRLRAQ